MYFSPAANMTLIVVDFAMLILSRLRQARLERATYGFEARRSVQLSYGRIRWSVFRPNSESACSVADSGANATVARVREPHQG